MAVGSSPSSPPRSGERISEGDLPAGGRRRPVRQGVRRDQVICLALAVILLGLIGFLQPGLKRGRTGLVYVNNRSVSNLLLEFPRLTLGGFRGILAMVLWEDAQRDIDRQRWVPLESDYNAIAALEPYFGSVYIFNAWNQSYNLSAQFHSLNTKYKWVLDGLVYLYKGQRYAPQDADIIKNEADDFFLKLGSSWERRYYCARWRYDIAHLYEYNPAKVNPAFSTLAEVHDLVTRPEFHAVLLPARDGKGPPGHGVKINGIHYRYGLSPFYFAWVEYRRMLAQPELPHNEGIEILDSWPSMSLRYWCRDDLYYAQRLTWRIFHEPEKKMLAHFPARVENIRDCYRNVKRVAPQALAAFKKYLAKFPDQVLARVHLVAEVQYYQALAPAESKLFEGLVQWQIDDRRFRLGDAADRDLAAAVPLFERARAAFTRFLDIAYPKGPKNQIGATRRNELTYRHAVDMQIRGITNFRLRAAHHKPDLGFLNYQTLSDNN